MINDYTKLIQSIKKEYQKLALGNEVLKNKVKKKKKIEYKQFMSELADHDQKQQEFFQGKRKRHYKKQTVYSESSSSGDTESGYFIPKKRKSKKKNNKKM